MRVILIVLVIAVILIVAVFYFALRKARAAIVDYTALAEKVKSELPLAPGIYGWTVKVYAGGYRYEKRHRKTCYHDNKSEKHSHQKPAIRVDLVNLLNGEAVETVYQNCFYWTDFGVDKRCLYPYSVAKMTRQIREKVSTLPEFYGNEA